MLLDQTPRPRTPPAALARVAENPQHPIAVRLDAAKAMLDRLHREATAQERAPAIHPLDRQLAEAKQAMDLLCVQVAAMRIPPVLKA